MGNYWITTQFEAASRWHLKKSFLIGAVDWEVSPSIVLVSIVILKSFIQLNLMKAFNERRTNSNLTFIQGSADSIKVPNLISSLISNISSLRSQDGSHCGRYHETLVLRSRNRINFQCAGFWFRVSLPDSWSQQRHYKLIELLRKRKKSLWWKKNCFWPEGSLMQTWKWV